MFCIPNFPQWCIVYNMFLHNNFRDSVYYGTRTKMNNLINVVNNLLQCCAAHCSTMLCCTLSTTVVNNHCSQLFTFNNHCSIIMLTTINKLFSSTIISSCSNSIVTTTSWKLIVYEYTKRFIKCVVCIAIVFDYFENSWSNCSELHLLPCIIYPNPVYTRKNWSGWCNVVRWTTPEQCCYQGSTTLVEFTMLMSNCFLIF